MGEWEKVEKYLSCFTTVDDNRYSMKIFFKIRKHRGGKRSWLGWGGGRGLTGGWGRGRGKEERVDEVSYELVCKR